MNCDCRRCASWRDLYWSHPLDRRRTRSYLGFTALILGGIITAYCLLAPSLEQIMGW
jgi:hypothetical protein